MKFGLPSETVHKISRLLLRAIPIVPGPEIFDLIIDIRKGERSINDKIDKAYKSLKETSQLIDDLEKELVERTDKVKRLRDKYDEYSKLADIEEEKIKPLLNQLEKTVDKGKNIERVVSFLINLVAGILLFILGIWAGPKVQGWFEDKSVSIETQENINNEDVPIDTLIEKNDSTQQRLKRQ